MKNRLPIALRTLGLFLLLISVGLPASVKLLHILGILQGWDGFGLFVIGVRLLPWLAGSGLLSLLLGVILGRKLRNA